MTVVLEGMSPAQEQGWLVLLDLFPNRRTDWTLIGGQMMFLLAVENGVTMPRTTIDMDVVTTPNLDCYQADSSAKASQVWATESASKPSLK